MRPEDKEDDYIEDKENEEIEDINSDTQDNGDYGGRGEYPFRL